jgi:hypothetical protein
LGLGFLLRGNPRKWKQPASMPALAGRCHRPSPLTPQRGPPVPPAPGISGKTRAPTPTP